MKVNMSTEKKNQWLLGTLLLVALTVRLLFLEWRPVHADEGVTGWFVDQIFETGLFKYDPTNFHGPLHYYFQFAVQAVFGRDMVVFRAGAAVLGVIAVWIMWKLNRIGALFMALSPGMIFYSRYATQEIDLMLLTLISFYGFLKDRQFLFLFGLVGMMATKETWVISAASFVIAATATSQWNRLKLSFKPIMLAVMLWALLFSSFGKNPAGILDFFKAFIPWLKTGESGSGHEKPANYFLMIMLRQEWPALLGVVAAARFLYTKNLNIRFFTLYGILQLIFYSLIPYKTPWCILEILWPFMIVAGIIVKEWPPRFATALVIALCGASMIHAIKLNFYNYVDVNEPYVYVQTFPEIKNVMEIIESAVKSDPSILSKSVLVALHSQWPIPWLLGAFKNAGYYDAYLPSSIDSDIIFSDKSRDTDIERMFKKNYYAVDFTLRPAMEDITVYLSTSVFEGKLLNQSQKFRLVKRGILR